jgi:hypothetical protein
MKNHTGLGAAVVLIAAFFTTALLGCAEAVPEEEAVKLDDQGRRLVTFSVPTRGYGSLSGGGSDQIRALNSDIAQSAWDYVEVVLQSKEKIPITPWESDYEYFTGSGMKGGDIRLTVPVGEYRAIMLAGISNGIRLLAVGIVSNVRRSVGADNNEDWDIEEGTVNITAETETITFTLSALKSNISSEKGSDIYIRVNGYGVDTHNAALAGTQADQLAELAKNITDLDGEGMYAGSHYDSVKNAKINLYSNSSQAANSASAAYAFVAYVYENAYFLTDSAAAFEAAVTAYTAAATAYQDYFTAAEAVRAAYDSDDSSADSLRTTADNLATTAASAAVAAASATPSIGDNADVSGLIQEVRAKSGVYPLNGVETPYFQIPKGVNNVLKADDSGGVLTRDNMYVPVIDGKLRLGGFYKVYKEEDVDGGKFLGAVGGGLSSIGLSAFNPLTNTAFYPVNVTGDVMYNKVTIVETTSDDEFGEPQQKLEIPFKIDTSNVKSSGFAKIRINVDVQAFPKIQGEQVVADKSGKRGSVWRVSNGLEDGAIDFGADWGETASIGKDILISVGTNPKGIIIDIASDGEITN